MTRRSLFIIFFIFFAAKLGISYEYAGHLFCMNPEVKSGKITAFNGDSFSYTGAMENYIAEGTYYFEAGGKRIYAGRIPHYSIPYFLLRQIFNKQTALDLFIVLQILLETIAWFLAALLIYKFSNSRWIFYLSLGFALFSYYYTHYTLIPITDSPAAALLFISFWYLHKYFLYEKMRAKDWVLFSLFISLASLIRPYFILIFLVVAGYLFVQSRYNFVFTLKKSLVVPVILLVMLAPWMIRNYNQSGKLIFFQQDMYAGYDISEELILTRKMLMALGEDASTMWDKKTAAGYFSPSMYNTSEWQIPAEITADSLLLNPFMSTRSLCIDSINDRLQSAAFRANYNSFIGRYKSQHGVKYYFINHLKRIKVFLKHSGSYYYSYNANDGCSNTIHLGLKILQSLFYYLALVAGSIGLIVLARQKKHAIVFLIPTFILIIFFPLILGITEWRYFLPFYFFHTVGLFYLFYVILKRLKLSK